MKVSSISGNLNSSYIYFKSSSKINRLVDNPAGIYVYNIPSKFTVDVQKNNIKKVISGKCENERYFVNIYDKNEQYMYGNIGWEPIYLTINKEKGLFHQKTRISGAIGNKNLDLVCKTRYGTKYITGKYGKEDVDVAIWESMVSEDLYIDGEKIKMTLSDDNFGSSRAVTGESSFSTQLLPVLAGLSQIRNNL